MKPPVHRGMPLAAACVLSLAVAACGDRSEDTSASSRTDSTRARSAASARDLKDGARSGSTGVMGAAPDARERAYSPGSGESKVDDTKLTAMVLTGLKADKELNPLRIDVDTRDGVVTLSGSVPSAAAKARASEIAQNVKDVKSVNNQLTLTAG